MSSNYNSGMGANTVIRCSEVGKCYKIYDNPKDRLKQALWRSKRNFFREFWAIRNISFEVARGQSLGIIGRNGSGKSTLLQLICGTLNPTVGAIHTSGRIAALLELGSGFNPEFTGVENIYLNASILGLSTEEINVEMDNILSFADIGKFVNQPVKTYSSGMAVRLAFAVIAHVSADILVVDEALAVGDAVFVQRCMRFIRRVREERCLLFVSHDSEAVKSLCSQALWLSEGEQRAYGNCKEVSLDYLRYCHATSYGEEASFTAVDHPKSASVQHNDKDGASLLPYNLNEQSYDYEVKASCLENLQEANGWKTGGAELIAMSIKPIKNVSFNEILTGGEEVEVRISAKANKTLNNPIIGFLFRDRLGQSLFGENTLIARTDQVESKANEGEILTAVFRLWLPMLQAGEYSVLASIADGDHKNHIQHHWLENAMIVRVTTSRVTYGLVGAFITHTELMII